MKATLSRHELQNQISKLAKQGKLARPESEVKAMPNWYLRKVIKLKS